MKTLSTEDRDIRFPLVIGASIGIGHGICRATIENLGTLWGLLISTAIIAVVTLGFCLVSGVKAKRKDTTSGQ